MAFTQTFWKSLIQTNIQASQNNNKGEAFHLIYVSLSTSIERQYMINDPRVPAILARERNNESKSIFEVNVLKHKIFSAEK